MIAETLGLILLTALIPGVAALGSFVGYGDDYGDDYGDCYGDGYGSDTQYPGEGYE